jgi:putative FmdB family regulatory protein
MPIYEYRCTECQQIFEDWCKQANDSTEHSCPTCKGQAHRIMSNTSFALKGGGWYATEYGSRRNEEKSGASCSDSTSSEAPAACASSGSCAGAGTCNAAAGVSA